MVESHGAVQVDIHVEVREATNHVQLHARELQISESYFTAENGDKIAVKALSMNFEKQILELEFAKQLEVGNGKLHVAFTGILNDQMAGFYRSSYTDANGNKKKMASTQFESIDARRAFPCWDEPAAKAIFDLTLIIPQELTAISNMPEESIVSLKDGTKKVHFMPSVKMSSYLLAFIVGEFDYLATVTEHGVPIRCFSTPGVAYRCEFALECAKRCLDLYDDYFKIPYPLPKLDMIAIPEFAAGAMENYGCITYRETDLLVDPVTATTGQRQRVCTVVTHELAHQWFGNLVTMAWWSGLWLNESFACFMQTWSADILFPEWKLWDQFIGDDYAAALRLDSLRSSHPIQVPINEASEVEEVFDAISYCKGATVIRMLNAVMGPEAFQTGLYNYFTKHAYGNTEGSDLWEAWTDASGKQIDKIAASWTEQMGHPLLRVSRSSSQGKTVLKCKQSWFLADGSTPSADEEKVWHLPLQIATAKNPDGKLYMFEAAEFTVELDGISDDDWVKVNMNHITPMRVIYEADDIKRLSAAVSAQELPVIDRAGLLLDCFQLTKAGLMDPADLIRLVGAYANETSSVVWDALNSVLISLHKTVIDDAKIESQLRKLAAKIVEPAFEVVGWKPKASDDHLTRMTRTSLVSLIARFSEKPEVIETARTMFDAAVADVNDNEACPTDIRIPVFQLVMKNGDAKTFEQIMEIYSQCDNDAQRKHVMHSIGFASTPALKLKVLDWTTNEVKLQDFFYPINSVSSSTAEGQKIAWKYLVANFDRLYGKVKNANPSIVHALVVLSSRNFVEKERIDEVEGFFKAHPIPGCDRGIEQMLESMRVTSAFAEHIKQSAMANDEFWATL